MSNLSKELLRQVIERVRQGADPKQIFPENFLESVGKDNYNNAMFEVIEEIWLPMGDKAFIRNGYHEAVQKIEHHFYPPEPLPEYSDNFDDEFIF